MLHSTESYDTAIPQPQRLLHGQYYTPAFLCDVILALCMQPDDSRLLEPSCGTGAFLQRALSRIATLPQSPAMHLQGIELNPQAGALAREQLASRIRDGLSCHIQTADFLSADMDQVERFDVIAGNPPYVRQERMAQSAVGHKQAAIDRLRQKYAAYLDAWPAQEALFTQTADLYIWFFLQAATLLKPGGRLAFITSNSWLNASYGQAFRQFLSHHFRIRCLVESTCERWFPDAAVNAIITVLEKKTDFSAPGNSAADESGVIDVIRFCQPLQHWLPDPDSPRYWQTLDHQLSQLAGNPNVEYKAIPLRTFAAHRANWALPLRAPSTLTTLLENHPLWRRLDALGQVRYPLKTGINRFFYVSRAQAEQWNLEPEFLFPVIRSARNITRYAIRPADCDEFLFACPLTKEQLAQSGKTGALAYIAWGEQQTAPPRQKRSQPIPWPQVASVQANRPGWYAIKPIPPAHILCNRFIDRRFFFALCQNDTPHDVMPGHIMEDQTFYGLTLSQPEATSPRLIGALLNATLSYLLVEFSGRTSLGEGVLQFARGDMAALPVLNPALFSVAEQQAIAEHFETMLTRSILPLPNELHQPDRIELDRLVVAPLLKQIGFPGDARTFREQWIDPLLNRMEERHTLARCFRKPRVQS